MNLKVLIVDDEVPILNGIKLNLGRTYDLTLVSGGLEAIKAAEEEGPFEAVVSDMRMPGMTGVEVLAKIKSMQRGKSNDCLRLEDRRGELPSYQPREWKRGSG